MSKKKQIIIADEGGKAYSLMVSKDYHLIDGAKIGDIVEVFGDLNREGIGQVSGKLMYIGEPVFG